MASCPCCGAEGIRPDGRCERCGAAAGAAPAASPASPPQFELDLPRPAPKAAAPPPAAPAQEAALELAVDPRAGRRDPPMMFDGDAPSAPRAAIARHVPIATAAGDVGSDARLLADYGRPPASVAGLPFYAWRVLRRQRELREGLAARRAEAERTRREAEDALVAFAGRVRSVIEADAQKAGQLAGDLSELRDAEGILRSRDTVLAAEQDAQAARLAAVAARLGQLEGALSQAQAAERKVAIELATAQAALSREETKLKRVEAELRAAQRRVETGGAEP